MSQQEQFRWHKALKAATQRTPSNQDRLEMGVRARNLTTCASGECLADLGIPEHYRHLAIYGQDLIFEHGAAFSLSVQAGKYRKALGHLATIRRTIRDNKTQILKQARL